MSGTSLITRSKRGLCAAAVAAAVLAALVIVSPPFAAQAAAASDPRYTPYTVAIDPGHGGRFSNANAGGAAEKTVDLALALELRRQLELVGFKVVMTRTTDQAVGTTDIPTWHYSAVARTWALYEDHVYPLGVPYDDLQARCNIANKAGADLFVCIHCNGAPSTAARGTETWTSAVDHPGRSLASLVQRNIVRTTGLPDRGAKLATFYVLQWANMPSVLVESGFITNPADRALLTSTTGQQRFGAGVVAGIEAWVGTRPLRQNWPRVGAGSLAGTSVAWSRRQFTAQHGLVVVTASRSPLDTLVALPLARRLGAPVLYADPTSIHDAVKAELGRLAPRAVYMVGSQAVMSEAVRTQVASASGCPTSAVYRVAGDNAYSTAARVALLMPTPASKQVCVVSAEAPLDGLALATWAARQSMPIVLVDRDGVPTETAAYLKARGITSTVVGASAKVLPDSVLAKLPGSRRIAGAYRYDACTHVLDVLYARRSAYPLLLASGDAAGDALIGAWAAVREGRPLMLTGRKVLPDFVRQWTQNHAGVSFLISGPTASVDTLAEADFLKAIRMRAASGSSVKAAVAVASSAASDATVVPASASGLSPAELSSMAASATAPYAGANAAQAASEEPCYR